MGLEVGDVFMVEEVRLDDFVEVFIGFCEVFDLGDKGVKVEEEREDEVVVVDSNGYLM